MNQKTLNQGQSFSQKARGIFKFFASVKLAIMLLVFMIAVLAAGTIIESYHGADAAKITVYDSVWFSIFLILLAVNLAAAAFDRFPWKKKHIGFVITHLGIIVILGGSLVTQKTMVDGQMALAEGETQARITLPHPLLYIYSPDERLDWLFHLSKRAFPWHGEERLKRPTSTGEAPLPLAVRLISYYPHAVSTESIKPAESGPAAVKVTLKNSFLNQSQWLVLNDPELGKIQMGPAQLVFSDELLKENAAQPSSSGYFEIEKEGKAFAVSIPENFQPGQEIAIEGSEYKIILERIFKQAAVSGNELVEREDIAPNPAVKFTVKGAGLEERHTAFARFPDFPTVHGMKPSDTGMRFLYRLPDSGSRGESHELRFVQTLEGLKIQVRKGMQVRTEAAKTGEEVSLGWMDLVYKIEEFLPHASHEHEYSPAESGPQAQGSPAIELKVEAPGFSKKIWIGQGMKQEVLVGGKQYDFVFGEKRTPAGFKITLKDFRVEHYPGTEKPASFESDVILKDDSRGYEQKATISMNKPLVYRGYHIYQASYSAEEGQPEISVFAVGRDPGVPFKYAGALIMVAGIVTMFFTRRPARPLEGATES